MIKRIACVTRATGLAPADFAGALPEAARAQHAGTAALRVEVCTLLPQLAPVAPRHDGFVVSWFADRATAAGSEQQLDPRVVETSVVVLAEPVVMRGQDWLDRRWQDPSPRLKHIAVARRTPALGAAEFDDRWRNHAGTHKAAGAAQAAPIPEVAKGSAYVQNHPLLDAGREWAYDAITEVWFDEEDSLRARVDYFAANPPGDELFAQTDLLAVREEVVLL